MRCKTSFGLRIVPAELRCKPISELMGLGFDTVDIAKSTHRTEAEVYNAFARERGKTERHEAAQKRGFYPVHELAVGEFFTVPTSNLQSVVSNAGAIKRKLGVKGQFQCAPEENGIRVVRLS